MVTKFVFQLPGARVTSIPAVPFSSNPVTAALPSGFSIAPPGGAVMAFPHKFSGGV